MQNNFARQNVSEISRSAHVPVHALQTAGLLPHLGWNHRFCTLKIYKIRLSLYPKKAVHISIETMERYPFRKGTLLFICALSLAFACQTVFPQTPDTSPPKNRPSVALVLGGGGARGFGIIPVLEVIDELGIPIDMIIGNSAGAIIGGLYSIGYTPEEIRRTVTDVNWSSMFADKPRSPLESLLEGRSTESSPIALKLGTNFSIEIGGGLSTGQNAYLLFKDLSVKIPSYIDFDSLPIPFRATAVNLITGELELIESGDIAEAIRSSMSIPGVFQPFPVDDKLYIDGFVRNNLPIQQARDMGYDIVIAVSLDEPLKSDPEYFKENPLNVATQTVRIAINTENPRQLQLADLVIHPPAGEYSFMDFRKAQKIYGESAKEKEKYRKALQSVLHLVYPETATGSGREGQGNASSRAQQSMETHQATNAARSGFTFTPSQSMPEQREGVYHNLPYAVPQQLVVYGAVETDMEYIQETFDRIKGKSLTPENLHLLVKAIYGTGNYMLVTPRIDVRPQQTVVELRLQQEEKENWVIMPNATFAGTITDDSIAKLTLALDLQFRGLTGTGSVMSLKTTMINDFGAAWLYMQPLGPHAYLQLAASAYLEQEFVSDGISSRKIVANKMAYANADLLWGIRFNEKHKLQAGGAIYWLNTNETKTPELEAQEALYPNSTVDVAAPLNIRYTFSTFDAPTFPSKGFYVRLDTTGVFPITDNRVPLGFNMTKVDFTAAIPIAPKFSLIVNTLAASDPSLQLEKIPNLVPFFGVALGDRMFFPNVSGKQQYGTQKFAAQLVLQFQPWENITVIGGQMFFNITGTAGIITMSHKDFSTDGINWNASMGAGLRINKTFSIMFRVGAGTTHRTIMPFVSLDIGSIRY